MTRQPRQPIERKWAPYATVARQYLGVSEDILKAAINAGKLKAYEKPITRGRTGTTRKNRSLFVYLDDVDAYIRAEWPEASS